MDKNELQKRLLEDKHINAYLNELKSELDKEMQKTFKKRDFDKIDELTQSIRELTESELSIHKRNVNGIAAIKEKAENNDRRSVSVRFKRLAAALCVCFATVVGLNIISFRAWGMNFFSAIIELRKGSISIDFGKQQHDVIELPASQDDPFGIKAKCNEYGIQPEIPMYLPDNFELINIDTQQLDILLNITFYFKNGNEKLNISYINYKDTDQIPPLNIPSDAYNVSEKEVNDHTIYILKEDNQFTATYIQEDMVYGIYADGLDYDECQKVIESFD